jgi:5-hydroxyisourate hydrolase
MSAITTHVLDTSAGRPAAGVPVHLERSTGDRWESLGRSETDTDGRARTLVADDKTVTPGLYRITFSTRPYFERSKTATFYPYVSVTFEVAADQHYHVPLLISPFGYSTYRGS